MDICNQCNQEIPKQQSFYEKYGVKICLSCFRTLPKCQKCKFPSDRLKSVPGLGKICYTCREKYQSEKTESCHLCQGKITDWESRYEGHGKSVCQNCYAKTKKRCFICGFPHESRNIPGLGSICEFCFKETVRKETKIQSLLTPISGFLKHFNHEMPKTIDFIRLDWRVVLGMQQEVPPAYPVKSFDDLMYYCYPVYFLKDKFYALPAIPKEWFIVAMAGQLVAADLCQKYKLNNLNGDSPFHQIARGWCHWISYTASRTLKYDRITKRLKNFPENDLRGLFSKFQAMSENRPPAEIILYANQNIENFAKKYL